MEDSLYLISKTFLLKALNLFFLILILSVPVAAQTVRNWDHYYLGTTFTYTDTKVQERIFPDRIYSDYNMGFLNPAEQYDLADSSFDFLDEAVIASSKGIEFHYAVKNFKKHFQLRLTGSFDQSSRLSSFLHTDYPDADPDDDTIRILTYEDAETIRSWSITPELILSSHPFFRKVYFYGGFGPSFRSGSAGKLSRTGTIKTIYPDSVDIKPVDAVYTGKTTYGSIEGRVMLGVEYRLKRFLGFRGEVQRRFILEAYKQGHLAELSGTSYKAGVQYYFSSNRYKGR